MSKHAHFSFPQLKDLLSSLLAGRKCGGLICLGALAVLFAIQPLDAREKISFNDDWRFERFAEMPDGSFQEEPPALYGVEVDDSDWRELKLPHDWGIEGPFRMDLPNRTGMLPWVGTGWYRKRFHLPESLDADQRVFVHFDGAMSDTEVWLNGERVGEWAYGYTSFRVELTRELNRGGENVLAVRLRNRPNSSRWYPGGGIYRNVWLEFVDPVAVDHWGAFVSTPEVSDESARVRVDVRLDNGSEKLVKAEVVVDIFEVGLKAESKPIRRVSSTPQMTVVSRNWFADTSFDLQLDDPKLWSTHEPHLYKAVVSVRSGGTIRDRYEVEFGVRSIEFDPEDGFLLNGERVPLQGVCMHHDLGPLGAAVNRRAIERQVELLQEMGCNAIRTAHNPPAPELLEICDRMGVLVIVEAFDCWAWSKTENDYGRFFRDWYQRDIESMVKRDRNHPSVIMWSSGNEIREQNNENGLEVSRLLTDTIKKFDPTRLVTAGCNNPASGTNGFQETVDVFGYNYKPHLYKKIHDSNPRVPLYGSETASTVSSRGEYFFPVGEGGSRGFQNYQVSSYDLYFPRWASTADREFEGQDRNPFVMGEFVWTGFDYLGEPTPYNPDGTNALNFQDEEEGARLLEEFLKMGRDAPSRSSYFGIFDLCGFRKDRFYLYQARWRPELPVAHLLPHWNWSERVGEVTPVHLYTSGDEAELFLNGRSLGRKRRGQFEYRLRWDDVRYEPGELFVQVYKYGEKWASDRVTTTGSAAAVTLKADRGVISGDGQDLSFVTVEIVDEEGRRVPAADSLVEFSVSGPAEIVAVGNGDSTSHASFQAKERRAYNGLCLVVLRSLPGAKGEAVLTARSDQLSGSELIIRVNAEG